FDSKRGTEISPSKAKSTLSGPEPLAFAGAIATRVSRCRGISPGVTISSATFGWQPAMTARLVNWRPSSNLTPLTRSEEHTSELQSRENLVCRLLLEKKKHTTNE